LGAVCRIIEAAAFWVSGERYEMTVQIDPVIE